MDLLTKQSWKALLWRLSSIFTGFLPEMVSFFALLLTQNQPPIGLEAELFRLLFESAEIATFTPQERIKYDFDMTTERDIKNQIAYAEEKGLEKGLEKGREEGRQEGREEGRQEERARIIEELRKQGVPEEVIAQVVKTS